MGFDSLIPTAAAEGLRMIRILLPDFQEFILRSHTSRAPYHSVRKVITDCRSQAAMMRPTGWVPRQPLWRPSRFRGAPVLNPSLFLRGWVHDSGVVFDLFFRGWIDDRRFLLFDNGSRTRIDARVARSENESREDDKKGRDDCCFHNTPYSPPAGHPVAVR